MKNENKPISKRILSLIGLLMIGAAGSGLWDIFLKDLVFKFGGYFVDLISLVYSGYIDSLYEKVGMSNSGLSILPSLFLILLIILFPIFLLLWSSRFSFVSDVENDNESSWNKISIRFVNIITKSKKRFIIFFMTLSIPLSIMYTGLLIEESSCIKAINYVERTIEIIRPKISELEYLTLRSDFRQIDNRNKLEAILIRIEDDAKKFKVTLPKTKFYGIDFDKMHIR